MQASSVRGEDPTGHAGGGGAGSDCADVSSVFAPPWREAFRRCCQELRNGSFVQAEPVNGSGGGGGGGDDGQDLEEAHRVSLGRPANKCPDGFR